MLTNCAMVLLYLYQPSSDGRMGLWYSGYNKTAIEYEDSSPFCFETLS